MAAAASSVTEFSSGLQANDTSKLGAIVAGPDGNLWFTDDGPVPAIGKITPTGQITEYSTGLQADHTSHLIDITTGPDGNLWFTDGGPLPAVGKITQSGQITEYSTGLQANHVSCPAGIAKGPDGNVWFTDQGTQCGSGLGANMVGKITPTGQITEYSAGLQAHNLSNPTTIATGPDGNLWFADAGVANLGGSAIGKATPAGQITEYPLGQKSLPADIVPGPDGNLWFTDQGATRAVGKITLSGQITEYSIGLQPANQSLPNALALAADGNLWFTDPGQTPEVGQITTAGSITETPVSLPAGTSQPHQLAEGPDSNLWMTDTGTEQVARISLGESPAITAPTVSAITTTGATITTTVNPLGAPVSSITIQYGPDTTYGQTIETTPSTLPLAGIPTTVNAALRGLSPASTIHYRIIATNTAGTTTGPDYYITTQTPTPPTISGLRQTHSRWRLGTAAARIARAVVHRRRKAPVGTRFVFRLNEAASIMITFTLHRTGRATSEGCQPATARNRGHRVCRLDLFAGQMTFSALAGSNTITFAGRLPNRSRLRRGAYSARFEASTDGGSSPAARLKFQIVR